MINVKDAPVDIDEMRLWVLAHEFAGDLPADGIPIHRRLQSRVKLRALDDEKLFAALVKSQNGNTRMDFRSDVRHLARALKTRGVR